MLIHQQSLTRGLAVCQTHTNVLMRGRVMHISAPQLRYSRSRHSVNPICCRMADLDPANINTLKEENERDYNSLFTPQRNYS